MEGAAVWVMAVASITPPVVVVDSYWGIDAESSQA